MKTNLFDFLDIIDKKLEIIRYPNQENRWTAKIERSDITNGILLTGVYGNGESPNEAILNYIPKIAGKLLVVNAATSYRQEFKVPDELFINS